MSYEPIRQSDPSVAVDAALGRIASDFTLLRQRPLDPEQIAWLGRLIAEAEADMVQRIVRRRSAMKPVRPRKAA